MKQGLVSLMLAAAAVATASSQGSVTAPIAELRRALEDQATITAVRPRMAVESRVTKGAPYSAEAVTEFVQMLPDGNRITRKTVTRTFRDSEGRTRREQTTTNWASGVETTTITIGDPVAGVSFILEPETRTAYREQHIVAMPRTVPPSGMGSRGGGGGGGGGRAGVVSPVPTPSERAAADIAVAGGRGGRAGFKVASDAAPATEQLGQQTIEGVLAEGTRTTTVIPAGAIGNDQPITVVSEQWFSPDLQVLVSTKHSDPRSGESTYRLVNIIRGEQDRSLFEVPADYTLKESRARQPMVRR
jgi:hypothetical protein